MHYLESILRVLVVGLALGAGLPAVFAVGLRAYATGAGGPGADGQEHSANVVLKIAGMVLFVFVAAVIAMAILWITRNTLIHHFGFDPFPYIKKK